MSWDEVRKRLPPPPGRHWRDSLAQSSGMEPTDGRELHEDTYRPRDQERARKRAARRRRRGRSR